MHSLDRCRALLTPDGLSDEESLRLLEPIGFRDPSAALRRLRLLAPEPAGREVLARTLPALLFALSEAATPDGSLLNFERLAQAVRDRTALFHYLAENPRAVEILVRLFVGSQFLTEILLRNPGYLERLTQHKRIAEFKNRQEYFEQGRAACAESSQHTDRLNALRRFQQWELLRLAACDSFGLMDLKTVTLQLALLADSLTQVCLALVAEDAGASDGTRSVRATVAEGTWSVPAASSDDFAVLAFGKLGGEELNYSSDIDLVFVCEKNSERYWGLGQKLIKAITEPLADGFLYRVDMRLRPWGNSGALVTTCNAYVDYLKKHGRLWEKQALLKARVIAGNLAVGEALLKRLEPIIFDVLPDEARSSVLHMKRQIEERLQKTGREWGEVKAGQGSIRDVEFVTQYLQLAHGRAVPAVRSINTLDGLVRLADLDILQGDEYRHLSTGYVFLRTVEHALQLMHNKQLHALPDSARELAYLARRLDFPGPHEFVQQYDRHCRAIRRIFDRHLLSSPGERAAADALPPRTVAVHLGEAAASYAELFPGEQAERHLALLDQLDERTIVKTDARPVGDGRWELTVVGYDQLGDLSLMCGLLFVYGFDIESGYVFTGAEVAEPRREARDVQRATEPKPGAAEVTLRTSGTPGAAPRRRKYVNVFRVRPPHIVAGTLRVPSAETSSAVRPGSQADGTLRVPATRAVSPAVWGRYESDLADLLRLGETGRQREAQGQLAKRVAAAIDNLPETTGPLLPVEIDIDNQSAPDATVMDIRAEDTTGFLYELTNALALSGTSIQRVWIRSEGNQVVDTLWVTDERGRKITDAARLNELRAAVVLIKHFTHLLPRSSNAEAALLHFREFLESLFQRADWVQDLALLQNSEVLEALARLLGVSDFLWHDFLRLQHANLFPVVADVQALQQVRTRAALQAELERVLAAARSTDEQRERLNAFKDREMLRTDMRHILGLQDQFGMFSQELTDIAEVVVGAACRICEEELVSLHGRPAGERADREVERREGGGRARMSALEPSRLSVCALGKFGGRELGFASDIELMFVYEADGQTSGPTVISNLEFYQKLVEGFRRTIAARRKGIFEIDLRLRPYGNAGSLAVSLETFEKYFAHDGAAWPYERQALVKLRPVAGDAEFGRMVEAARDRVCYSGRPFNVAAMRAMREKQLRQLVTAGTFNAKLSPGGLVDCEYLVQGLQMTYGHLDAALRATNTREALKALTAAGVLSENDRLRLRDAYRFLRRVIDGLRMVRGDARDLTVPPADSEEFEFLARRLGYGPRVRELQADLERHTEDIRELTRRLDHLPAQENA